MEPQGLREFDTVVIAIGDGLDAACVDNYAKLRDILIPGAASTSQTIVLLNLKALQSAGMDIADKQPSSAASRNCNTCLARQRVLIPVAEKLNGLSSHLVVIMDNGTFHLKSGEGSLQFMPNFKRSDNAYLANELGVYIASLVTYAFGGKAIG